MEFTPVIVVNGCKPPKESYVAELLKEFRKNRGFEIQVVIMHGTYAKKARQAVLDSAVDVKHVIVECGGDATKFNVNI